MAAKGGDDSNGGNASESNAPGDKGNSLEGFISEQLAQQSLSRDGKPGENIDDEKMTRFLARATSESKRMNKEVAKSEAKMGKLHAELGKERLAQWRQEHAAEVLTHQAAGLVEMTHKPQ